MTRALSTFFATSNVTNVLGLFITLPPNKREKICFIFSIILRLALFLIIIGLSKERRKKERKKERKQARKKERRKERKRERKRERVRERK